jgi:proline iminopeptidase
MVKFGYLDLKNIRVPYFIEGEGLPCIVTGDIHLTRKAFSTNLRKHIEFVFVEQRVLHKPDRPFYDENITLDTIAEDIEKMREKAGHEKVAVLGFSVTGLFSLYYAQKFPQNVSHVIMINSPPYYIPELFWEKVEENWKKNASEERKKEYVRLQEEYERKKKNYSPDELTIQNYLSAAPRLLADPSYDMRRFWKGYRENENVFKYFENIFSEYDFRLGYPVSCPVYLTLGKYDYTVPEFFWDDFKDHILNLTVEVFENSGHYPFIEEQELFEKRLISWIKTH